MAFRTTSETHLFIERLIEAVKKRPTLYDPDHEDYRDYKEKAAAWTSVTLELGYENGDESAIKQKWKNLRDSYSKYRKTRNNPDDTRIKNYKHWPWANHMAFTEVGFSGDTSSRAINTFEEESNQDPNMNYAIGSPGDFDDEPPTEEAEEEEERDVKPTNLDFRRKPERKRRNNDKKDSIVAPSPTTEDADADQLQKRSKKIDSVDLLFQSYAKTLKTFTPKRRALMKMQISNMFAQAEIEEIEEREQGYAGNGLDPLLGGVTEPADEHIGDDDGKTG